MDFEDLDDARREVFLASLEYINIPQAVTESITNGINNATDEVLANIQRSINLNNDTLNQLQLAVMMGNMDEAQTYILTQLGQKLFNTFNELGMQGGAVAPKKKTRFIKGSQEAKDFMASIRAKKGGSKPKTENITMVVAEIKPTGRKSKYASEEERKEAKKQQTLASNKKRRAELKGEGVFDDISNAIKNTYKSVVGKTKQVVGKTKEAVENTFNSAVGTAKQAVKNVKEYANVVVKGRNDYPPKVRKILRELGSKMVKSAVVMRAPVPSVLTGALNAVSLGAFSRNFKNAPYDTLFHLSLVLDLEGGTRLLIEKNEVLNMDKNPSTPPKTDVQPVPNVPTNVSVNEMLEKAKERMGDKYFTYSARDNNCQDYIMAILQANNMGDNATFQFVKQDTKQLFEGLITLRKVSNTITDIGAKVNEITTGAGMDQNKAPRIKMTFRDNEVELRRRIAVLVDGIAQTNEQLANLELELQRIINQPSRKHFYTRAQILEQMREGREWLRQQNDMIRDIEAELREMQGRGMNVPRPPAIQMYPEMDDEEIRNRIEDMREAMVATNRRIADVERQIQALVMYPPPVPPRIFNLEYFEEQLDVGRSLLERQRNMISTLERELQNRIGRGLKNNISNNNITIMPKHMKGGNLRNDVKNILSSYTWFMDLDVATQRGTIMGAEQYVNRSYGGSTSNIPNLEVFANEVRDIIAPAPPQITAKYMKGIFKEDSGKGLYAGASRGRGMCGTESGGYGLYAGASRNGRGVHMMPDGSMMRDEMHMMGTGMGAIMQPTHTIIHYYGGHSMQGEGFLDDLKKAFSPKAIEQAFQPVAQAFQPVAQAFTPKAIEQAFQPVSQAVKNIVPDVQKVVKEQVKQRIVNPARKALKPGGSGEKFGKQVASALIRQGIPATAGVLGGLAGSTLAPGTFGVGSLVGSQVGTRLGNMGAEELAKATGYGVARKGRFVKGSQEAKDYMASIRGKKNA